MDIKNFMLNDWVMEEEAIHYTQVTHVTPDMIWEGYDWNAIPLTEDILKANGFTNRYECGWQNPKRHLTMYLDCYRFLHGIPYIDEHLDAIYGIEYVHQFQQALRLVGLTDFADNLVMPNSPLNR